MWSKEGERSSEKLTFKLRPGWLGSYQVRTWGALY